MTRTETLDDLLDHTIVGAHVSAWLSCLEGLAVVEDVIDDIVDLRLLGLRGALRTTVTSLGALQEVVIRDVKGLFVA